MVVLVTLNSGQGVNLGPNFTLSANTGTITPATATLTQLLAGIYVTVDNAAVSVTITSTGSCTNSLVLNINSITTTTTTTTTTTAAPTTTTTAAPTTTTTASPTTTTTAAPTTTTTTTAAPTTTTTTTTSAPTTTTTTTVAPTTTTTSTSTTTTTSTSTTTTTTLAPVSFSTSGGCANYAISDGVGAMVSFNGGSGVYQASDVTYSTQVAAENGTYTNVSVSRTFTGLAAATYWVALRDTNDTSNKIANSFTITTCPTTTTTTQAPVSATVSGACTGITQTITVNSFTGGDGSTYYVSNATYGDAGSAGAATANVLVSGGTYSYASQPSGTRYIKIASTIRTSVLSGGSTCTTTSTTTTTLPPTTTTTTQPQVWYNLYNCSTGGIETSASFLNGTFAIDQRVVYGGSLFFYVTQVLYTNPGGIQWSVSSAGAGLTFCPATTSTTTTTTLPPLVISNGAVTCSGITGSFTSSFTGGTSTYTFVAIADSQANAATCVAGGACGTGGFRVTLGGGATSYNFSGIANGNWYTAVRDSLPQTSVQNTAVSINCTTTTAAPTTTTTAAPLCTSWTVSNFNGFGLGDTVNYIDCSGTSQSTFIGDGNQFDICVLNSGTPAPYMDFSYGSVTSNAVPCP